MILCEAFAELPDPHTVPAQRHDEEPEIGGSLGGSLSCLRRRHLCDHLGFVTVHAVRIINGNTTVDLSPPMSHAFLIVVSGPCILHA